MTIPYAGTRFGGPVFSLASITKGISDVGQTTTVLYGESVTDGTAVEIAPTVRVCSGRVYNAWGFRWCPSMSRLAERAVRDGRNVVHSHGLWTDVHRRVARVARSTKTPHVISICGMLAGGAIRRHWLKKLPAKLMFQDRALREAGCLHATSAKELAEIRDYGLRNPVAVIPLPVEIDSPTEQEQRMFDKKHRLTGSKRYVLFLGRIHPVKGLENLVNAWARITNDHPEGHLLIAGPDEGGHKATVEALVTDLGMQGSITFIGVVEGREKWACYGAASLFIMPSEFENFGLAIAEAAAVGLPIITTTGTPWQALHENGGGWWVPNSPEQLAQTLATALAMPDFELRSTGRRAQGLVSPLTVGAVALQFLQVYRWLANREQRPTCVDIV